MNMFDVGVLLASVPPWALLSWALGAGLGMLLTAARSVCVVGLKQA